MNWDAIGAIGEVAGAVAVIATLVYLAIQIKHNSKIASIQASQHLLEGSSMFQLRIAENSDLRRIYAEGCASFESLSAEDSRVFYALIGEFLQRFEVQTQMHEAGILNDDNFAAASRAVTRLLSRPGARTVCKIAIANEVPSERFKKVIESLLLESETAATDQTDT